ncbi:hypothetical protein NL676_021041 [Syzygium grande]|nr:hypothetical protein NL676_021041 [Syzygium grande]
MNPLFPSLSQPEDAGTPSWDKLWLTMGLLWDMTSLGNRWRGATVFWSWSLGHYANRVDCQQLWIDVLEETLKHGVAPVSWTDYLYLTVGGTLSNVGISGQTFRYGPQIRNVYEMDVITAFTMDQERLISHHGRDQDEALDYVEGLLLMRRNADGWISFFSLSDHQRLMSLVTEHELLYCIEVAKYYDGRTRRTVDKDLEKILKNLSHVPEFMFEKDVAYVDFLNRVRVEELGLRGQGLWKVPHPWLHLFVPKSGIADFNLGVFKNIVLKKNITTGTVLIFPMNKNKWDDRMSAVIPDEDVFYAGCILAIKWV